MRFSSTCNVPALQKNSMNNMPKKTFYTVKRSSLTSEVFRWSHKLLFQVYKLSTLCPLRHIITLSSSFHFLLGYWKFELSGVQIRVCWGFCISSHRGRHFTLSSQHRNWRTRCFWFFSPLFTPRQPFSSSKPTNYFSSSVLMYFAQLLP